jgi:phytoene synthase
MTRAATAISASAYCAEVLRAADFDRYVTTLLTPAAHRAALQALYAFNSEIARVRDQVSQPMAGEIRLQWWSDALAGAGHGDVAANPVAAELIATAGTYGLPVERLRDLIDAHRFDLYDDPMPSTADLRSYIADTATNLFDLGARVVGATAPIPSEIVHDAGLAYGLTALVVAVPRHAARGQLFLPGDLMERFAVREADIFAGRATPELAQLIAHLAATARQHLDQALQRLPAIPRPFRTVLLPLALTGPTLHRLARAGHNPFALAPPSRLARLWTLWRAARRFDRA